MAAAGAGCVADQDVMMGIEAKQWNVSWKGPVDERQSIADQLKELLGLSEDEGLEPLEPEQLGAAVSVSSGAKAKGQGHLGPGGARKAPEAARRRTLGIVGNSRRRLRGPGSAPPPSARWRPSPWEETGSSG